MLEYQNDKRYIIYYSLRSLNHKKLGPYKTGMLPEIYNSDGTARSIREIPESDKSVYDLYPNLRSEFVRFTDPKYSNLALKDIKQNSNLKAEWQCSKCGHQWMTTVEARTLQGKGCKYCGKQQISFPEKYMYYCLKQVDPNLQENYKILNSQNLEFDMYDPASRLALEFNGAYHNKDRADDKKQQLAINNNINLIRVWQYRGGKKLDLTDKNNYIIPDNNSINNVPYLDMIINDICKQYGADYQKINRFWAQNQAFIRTNKTPPAGESLLDQYPDLCRDWDYNKNGVIRPEMLKPAQNLRVWWKCMYCGKSWIQQPNNRTASNKSNRAGCQACNAKIGRGILREMPYIPGK